MKLDIAISPCPNDTFIFAYLGLNGFQNREVELHFHDVEKLNEIALENQEFTVSKNSFYTILKLSDSYELLESGGALGRGCGPLLISNLQTGENQLQNILKKNRRILIPGCHTTANLLLHLYLNDREINPDEIEFIPMRYDKIINSLKTNSDSLGLIIHEERFTFMKEGFHAVRDLGKWWEEKYDLPIPLGGICLRKDKLDIKEELQESIKESIHRARQNISNIMPFIRKHAQSLDDDVIRAHINLYVNDFSLNQGNEGREAVRALKEAAIKARLL